MFLPLSLTLLVSSSLAARTPYFPRAKSSNGFVHVPLEAVRRGSSELQSRDTVNTTILNEQWLYAVEVSIGTPPQLTYVAVDTGSSEMWVNANCSSAPEEFGQQEQCEQVPKYDPTSSSSAQGPSGNSTVGYGYWNASDNSGSGYVNTVAGVELQDYTDTIRIGGANITAQQFGVGVNSIGLPIGIIGLSPDLDNGFAKNESHLLVLDSLVEQGVINSRAYSLNAARGADTSGSLILGGVDKSKFTGSLQKLPIVKSRDDKYRLTVDLTSIGMDLPSGKAQFKLNDTNVLLDSGHTFSTLHEDIVDQVWANLNATLDPSSGYPIVDCAKRDMDGGMLFTFRNKTITVPFSDVILTAEGLCAVGLLKTAESEQQVLGITFLRAAYAVFDWDNQEIHLAQGANCGSDIVAITTGSNAVPSVTGCAAATYPTLPASSGSRFDQRGLFSVAFVALVSLVLAVL